MLFAAVCSPMLVSCSVPTPGRRWKHYSAIFGPTQVPMSARCRMPLLDKCWMNAGLWCKTASLQHWLQRWDEFDKCLQLHLANIGPTMQCLLGNYNYIMFCDENTFGQFCFNCFWPEGIFAFSGALARNSELQDCNLKIAKLFHENDFLRYTSQTLSFRENIFSLENRQFFPTFLREPVGRFLQRLNCTTAYNPSACVSGPGTQENPNALCRIFVST